jgi:hypothetical protein
VWRTDVAYFLEYDYVTGSWQNFVLLCQWKSLQLIPLKYPPMEFVLLHANPVEHLSSTLRT